MSTGLTKSCSKRGEMRPESPSRSMFAQVQSVGTHIESRAYMHAKNEGVDISCEIIISGKKYCPVDQICAA